MPTHNINFTDHQDRFVAQGMASGQYQNASEVVRDALRLLEQQTAEDAIRLARLRAALAEAEDTIASGDVEKIGVDQLDAWLDPVGANGR